VAHLNWAEACQESIESVVDHLKIVDVGKHFALCLEGKGKESRVKSWQRFHWQRFCCSSQGQMKSTFPVFWFDFVVSVSRHIPLNAGRSRVIHCGPSVDFTHLVIMPLSESQFSGFTQHRLSSTPAFGAIDVTTILHPPSGKFDLAQPQLILHQFLALNLLPS
jgi:hypothetical protein